MFNHHRQGRYQYTQSTRRARPRCFQALGQVGAFCSGAAVALGRHRRPSWCRWWKPGPPAGTLERECGRAPPPLCQAWVEGWVTRAPQRAVSGDWPQCWGLSGSPGLGPTCAPCGGAPPSGLTVCQGDPAHYPPGSHQKGREALLENEGLWTTKGKGDIKRERPRILEGRWQGQWEPSPGPPIFAIAARNGRTRGRSIRL